MTNVPTPESAGAVQSVAGQTFSGLSIKTEGLAKNTVILLNGKPIKDLYSLTFRFSRDPYGYVSIEYTTNDHKDSEPGSITSSSTFYVRPPAEKAVAHIEAGEIPSDLQPKAAATKNLLMEM